MDSASESPLVVPDSGAGRGGGVADPPPPAAERSARGTGWDGPSAQERPHKRSNEPNRTDRQRRVRSRRAPRHHCAPRAWPHHGERSLLAGHLPRGPPRPRAPSHPCFMDVAVTLVGWKVSCLMSVNAPVQQPLRARRASRGRVPGSAQLSTGGRREGESVSILLYSNEVIFLEILYYVDFLYSCRFVLPDNLFAFPRSPQRRRALCSVLSVLLCGFSVRATSAGVQAHPFTYRASVIRFHQRTFRFLVCFNPGRVKE